MDVNLLVDFAYAIPAGVLASILTEIIKQAPLIDKETNQYYKWIVFSISIILSFFFVFVLQSVGIIAPGWGVLAIAGTLAAGASSLTYTGLIETIKKTGGSGEK